MSVWLWVWLCRLVDVYMMVKADSHQVTLEILHLVLRGCSSTDER